MDPDDTNPMSWILEDGSLLVLTTTEEGFSLDLYSEEEVPAVTIEHTADGWAKSLRWAKSLLQPETTEGETSCKK